MTEKLSCSRLLLDHDEESLNLQRAQLGESVPSQQLSARADGTPSVSHHAISEDQTADVEAAEPQLPDVHCKELQIDQGQETNDGLLTGAPSSSNNAASPSKHDHVDGLQFGQPHPIHHCWGTSYGISAAESMNTFNRGINLLTENGINPSYLTPAQMELFQAQSPQIQEQSIRLYASNMLIHQQRQYMPSPGSTIIQPGVDDNMPGSSNGITALQMNLGIQINSAGNHALQDYQMQLMLLEQQNKRRLLLAKQEQDRVEGDGLVMPGQPAGMFQTHPDACEATLPSHIKKHDDSGPATRQSRL